jgi:signal peptidase I
MRIPRKRLIRLVGLALFLLPILAWGIWLRPEFAGGRVDYIIVGGKSMQPTLHGGDLVIVQRETTYRAGDIVAYHIPSGLFQGRRIIHRIVGGDPVHGFVMRGDNNADDDLWYPRPIDIEGKLWKRVPAAGQVVAFARAPAVLAAVAGGFVFAFVLTSGGAQRRGALSPATGVGEGPSAREP